MGIGQSIKKSFLNETANDFILLLLIWGGIAAADLYFNKIMGIGLISFLALILCILVGFAYIVAIHQKSRFSPNGVAYFVVNGKNYCVIQGSTAIGKPQATSFIIIAIKSLMALPIYLFKLILRVVQSITSETYRENINTYYDANKDDIKRKLKSGVMISKLYVLLVAFLFGLYGLQCAIYSPQKIKFTNVQLQSYSNALGEGYYFTFDYYSSSNRVVEMHTGNSNDDVVLYIKDRQGNITYQLKNEFLILDTYKKNERKTDCVYLGDDFVYGVHYQEGYKVYLVFDTLVGKGLISTAERQLNDYAIRIK